MKFSSFVLVLFLFICLSFSSSFAQLEPPIKWGEIPLSDLQMKSFPKDTNATALILCDYGESTFNDDLNIVFKRHMRIKILTAKGYDWGTHSVTLWTDGHTESIHNIEGMTYRLDDKGAIVKNELNSDDIFEEKVSGGWTRVRFTLPALQPGCVVEFRYNIVAESIYYMRDWMFQYSEPVRWSEYRMRYPKALAYAGVKRGFESFAVDEREDVTQIFSGTALAYFNQPVVNCNQWRIVLKDAPAIRDEPFVTTTKDYLNQLDVQLAGYAFPGGGGKKQILNDWPTVVKELLDNKYFYNMIDDTRMVRKTVEQLTAGLQSPEEKMKAIYDWVRSSIVWSGENSIFADQEVNDLMESKKGNCADITFLLISLLKSAGIDADPVIFSTRSHGQIQDIYPIVSQFNYVVTRTTIGTKNYLLDPTDPYRPMDLLPVKILGTRGLLIRENNWGWIGVASDKVDEETSSASIQLSSDGSVSGKLEKSLSAYSSLDLRRKLNDKKETDVAKEEFDAERSALALDSVLISNKDSLSLPLNIKASFTSSSYAQRNGEMIYINPQIVNRLWENPFKAVVRNFPIDYAYKRKVTSTISINIPEGFEVKEKLKDITTYAGARALSFTRQSKVEGNKMTVTCTIDIKEAQIKPRFYEQLRDFYGAMVSSESEQIVLSRIQPQIQPVTAPAGNSNEKAELPEKTEKTKSKVKKGKA